MPDIVHPPESRKFDDAPLVAVGGVALGKGRGIALYMRQGYDRLPASPESYFNQFRDHKPGVYVVGDLNNPHFGWPVWVEVYNSI